MPLTTIDFPPRLLDRIEAVAQHQGVSRNSFMVRACRDAVARDAAEWPENFFRLDLDDSELGVLRQAGAEMETSILDARRSRGAALP